MSASWALLRGATCSKGGLNATDSLLIYSFFLFCERTHTEERFHEQNRYDAPGIAGVGAAGEGGRVDFFDRFFSGPDKCSGT